jgi:hypothetical protein
MNTLRETAETDKSDTNEATGESWYYTTVRALWSNAKAMAKYDLIEEGETVNKQFLSIFAN